MKITLLENIHTVAEQNLKEKGYEVNLHTGSYTGDELVQVLQSVDVVGIRSKTQLTQEVLDQCQHLQAIGCFCIGTNQVNLAVAKMFGIPVFNAPYSNTRSVAELVIGEIIALSRKLYHLSSLAHQGSWQKTASGSFEVRGKTLGIVGYGHIGSQVSILAEAFGMKVIYYDIIKKLPLGNSQPVESMQDLLKKSDFVTLHVPATEETKNMIGNDELSLMPKDSYLINASRGSVVDIPALAQHLKNDHLAGAAVDVYPKEPKSNSEDFQSELQNCNNVILTPHIGGSTQEAQVNIGSEVSEALSAFLQFGQTAGSVNFPQIQAAPRPSCKRLLNVHKNVPGVLGEINSIVSEAGVNILSQHLGTDDSIGYLLMDIEAGQDAVCQQISKLTTSIKTRVL